MTDNSTNTIPDTDTPMDDSDFASAVFADPVGYLAGHGISARLVDVTVLPVPKAA